MEKSASKESNKSLIKVNAAKLSEMLSMNNQHPFRFEVVEPKEVTVKDKQGWIEEVVENCVERINSQFSSIAKVSASVKFSADQSEIIGKTIIELELNTEPKLSSEEERSKWFKNIKNAASKLFGFEESYMDMENDEKKGFKYSILFPAIFTTVDCRAMNKETRSKEPWELAYKETEEKKMDLVTPLLHVMNMIVWYDKCVKGYDKLNRESEEKKEAYFTSIKRLS